MRKVLIAAAVIIGAGAVYLGLSGHGRADYRDPLQLARAMKAQEHSYDANCAKLSGTSYLCYVGNTDMTMAAYRVTVAPDGSSFTSAAP